jgi:hypothetical protein
MKLTADTSEFVMRKCRTALFVLILLAATASFAQKVHVGFDKGVDFSKFKTYAWLESKHPAQGAWAKQIVADVDRQLTRKGLKKVDAAAGPDLQVVYNVGIKERSISAGCDYGCVLAEYLFNQLYGPQWFWPEPGSWVSEVEKNGSLVVDLVDASSKDTVWRGVATDTLSDKTKKNEHKVNKAIRRMFKKYPPKEARR